MPVSVALTFTGGRFHATPWGHHVNEALPEWPPSPWRLLRALVALWKRKLPDLTRAHIEPVLAALAHELPSFALPPATLGHTRHYMPTDGNPTKVFDAFVAVPSSAELVFHWPNANLEPVERETLAALLGKLGYFGRAESWCAAQLLDTFDAVKVNCAPLSGAQPERTEPVRVLAPNPETWRDWSFGKGAPVPDPNWNLLAETADLHRERWSDPPGAKWITYARRTDCFARPLAARPKSEGDAKTRFTTARFVLDVAEGRRPLPAVTETVTLADAVRSALGKQYGGVARQRFGQLDRDDPRRYSQTFFGKDEHGTPFKSHNHAFYLPSDEDGDGRIDHVTVHASGGFTRDDVSALDRLRALAFSEEAGLGRDTHRLLLVGLDAEPPAVGLFGEATEWESATPYIAFRHIKERGRKRARREFFAPEALGAFLKEVLRADFAQRADLANPARIEYLPQQTAPRAAGGLGWRYRALEFRRERRKGGDGFTRAFGTFRLTFDTPVRGPLALGYAAHFGMGAFRPTNHDELPAVVSCS